jgi:hypothetical protein
MARRPRDRRRSAPEVLVTRFAPLLAVVAILVGGVVLVYVMMRRAAAHFSNEHRRRRHGRGHPVPGGRRRR